MDRGSLGLPHALNLPLQFHAALVLDAAADFLAERLDVGARRLTHVDEEVRVFLADLRAADHKATAAGLVDKLPRLVALRVLEGRAAGLRTQRLRGFAARRDEVHFGLDRRGLDRKSTRLN